MDIPVSLACKLGSIAVHADEFLSAGGHQFDADAIKAILKDPEVSAWLEQMEAAALLPRKRSA